MNKRRWSMVGLAVLGILLFWSGSVFGQTWSPLYGGSTAWMMGTSGGWGMMNGQSGAMMGGGGLMGNFSGRPAGEPMSIEDAETAVATYVAALNDENLVPGEIMIFDNHAYAQVMDAGSGQGAFEVLIDPATGNVFPEPGPNMMWNNVYGMMGGSGAMGMMGGDMMAGFVSTPDRATTITADEALASARTYLAIAQPGAAVEATAVAFPGYYTLHIERDGLVSGMLSVNAYSGQVFIHNWHGRFIEMTGDDHS